MIDLASMFNEMAGELEKGVSAFPPFRTSHAESQVSDINNFSVISDVSAAAEIQTEFPPIEAAQARAGGRAGERARGAPPQQAETSETAEKPFPAGHYLSVSSLENTEKTEIDGQALHPAGPIPLEERAAFLEYECGLSRSDAEAQAQAEGAAFPCGGRVTSWAAGLARLHPTESPCPGYRSSEWPAVLARALAFLDAFGAQAEVLGWTAPRLFGVHPTVGIVRVDACGGLVLPIGGEIRAITATTISFGHLTHRQKPGQPEGVPWWEFSR